MFWKILHYFAKAVKSREKSGTRCIVAWLGKGAWLKAQARMDTSADPKPPNQNKKNQKKTQHELKNIP